MQPPMNADERGKRQKQIATEITENTTRGERAGLGIPIPDSLLKNLDQLAAELKIAPLV